MKTLDHELAKEKHNRTIKADLKIIIEIKRIAKLEERNIQTITNRLLKLGLNNYPSSKLSFNK